MPRDWRCGASTNVSDSEGALLDPPTRYDVIPGSIKMEDFHKHPEDYVARPSYESRAQR